MHIAALRRIFLPLIFASFMLVRGLAQPSASATWRLADGTPFSTQAGVRLPAGAEITRTLMGDPVGVRIVSRPYFSVTPKAWPMISVAQTTLTFSRDEAGGGVILVGDSLLPLPLRVELDTAGRSLVPVDVTMTVSQAQGVAMVSIPGQPAAEVKTAVLPGAVALTLAAGSDYVWEIDLMEEIPPPVPGTGAAGTAGASTADGKPKPAADDKPRGSAKADALNAALAAYRKGEKANLEALLAVANRAKPGTLAWDFETAAMLVQLATAVRLQRDHTGAEALARRALALIEKGEAPRQEAKSAELAIGHDLAGYIHERLLFDEATARRSYAQAAELNPQAMRAHEAVARIDERRANNDRLGRRNK